MVSSAKKSGDSVALAVSDGKVPGEVAAYAAIFATSKSERMNTYLYYGSNNEKHRDEINAWMRKYCSEHPQAKTMDGVRELAPKLLEGREFK